MSKEKYKILTVVGARPQFIKAAPLSKAIAQSEKLMEIMVHTGQHYDYALSQQFFEELELPPPQYNLEIGSARHVVQMGQILLRLDAILETKKPDMVVVFGDTNSTAAAAIAAAKNHIPLAHVEAGLREWNRQTPEEINKMLTDAVTDLYFCPTQTGVQNLQKTGITEGVHLVGDIGMDLIFNNLEKIEAHQSVLKTYGLEADNYYFMTCHRAVNTDVVENLKQILRIFAHIEEPIVFPIHPRTRAMIAQYGLEKMVDLPHLHLIEPLGFWATQALIRSSKMVLTDSGGVIKEAYCHQKPCVILQNEIEWVEAVAEGWAVLAGNQTKRILSVITHFLSPQAIHRNPKAVRSQFLGNGTAAMQICRIIETYLSKHIPL